MHDKELDRSVLPVSPSEIHSMDVCRSEDDQGGTVPKDHATATAGMKLEVQDTGQPVNEHNCTPQAYPDGVSPEAVHGCSTENGSRPTTQQSVPANNDQDGSACESGNKRANSSSSSDEDAPREYHRSSRDKIREDLESGKYDIPLLRNPVLTENVAAPSGGIPPPLPPQRQSRHRSRFDRSYLLPDRKKPLNAQIMEHVKDWAELASRIEDDQRRKEVLDRVFETLANVWYEALRVGYNPGHYEPSQPLQSARRTSSTITTTKPRKEHGPGRPPGATARPRQRSATRDPILTSRSHKDGPFWAITAGELQEAGISEQRIRQRAASWSLQQGNELLEAVTQCLGHDICRGDWWNVTKTTKLNPWGRNLMVYSLYEVQMSRQSITHLETLYRGFSQARQKENTQRRIDEEQQRLSLFMALALEINEKEVSSRSPTPPVQEHKAADEPRGLAKVAHVNEVDPTTEATPRASSVEKNALKHPLPTEDVVVVDREEPPSKRQKRQTDMTNQALATSGGQWDNESTVDAINTATDVSKSYASAEVPDSKKGRYIQFHILPRVNEMLTKAGVSATTSTNWGSLRDALKNAGVSIDDRNALTRQINVGYEQGWHLSGQDTKMCTQSGTRAADNRVPQEMPVKEETQALPAREDTQASLAKQETQASPTKEDTQLLLAKEDTQVSLAKEETQALPAKEEKLESVAPLEHRRRSLIVKLSVPSDFDPSDLSSETVFSHKGFKYRYTRYSTLAQRKSMDEVLDTYVRGKIRPQASLGAFWRPEPRYGKYEVLTHPHDSARTSIIHGFWDLKDGSQVQGAEWFYHGNGEIEHPGQTTAHDDDDDDPVSMAPSAAGSKPGATSSPADPPVNKNLKNVIHLKRDSANWTVDNGGSATNTRRPNVIKPKHKAAGVVLPSPSLTTARSGFGSSEKRQRRNRKRASGDDSDNDGDYQP